MPDNSGAVDLGSLSQEEKEAVEKIAAEQGEPDGEQEKTKVLTAFTVIVDYDGNPQITAFEAEDILLQSNPTQDLIFAACTVIMKDMQVLETAQATAQMTAQYMMQQARAMAEQQQSQQIAAGLNLRGPRG